MAVSAGAVKDELETKTDGDYECQLESLKTELDVLKNRLAYLYQLWAREHMDGDVSGKTKESEITATDMEWLQRTFRDAMTEEEAVGSVRHDRDTR